MRCAVGMTDDRLQGEGEDYITDLTQSPFLFTMVMDSLIVEGRLEWMMMFADDFMICRVKSRLKKAWRGGGVL